MTRWIATAWIWDHRTWGYVAIDDVVTADTREEACRVMRESFSDSEDIQRVTAFPMRDVAAAMDAGAVREAAEIMKQVEE